MTDGKNLLFPFILIFSVNDINNNNEIELSEALTVYNLQVLPRISLQ